MTGYSRKTKIKFAIAVILETVFLLVMTAYLNSYFRGTILPLFSIYGLIAKYVRQLNIKSWLVIAACFAALMIDLVIFFNSLAGINRNSYKENKETKGKARWATAKDLKSQNLLDPVSGIILGQTADAVFEYRTKNKKEKQKIENTYNEKIQKLDQEYSLQEIAVSNNEEAFNWYMETACGIKSDKENEVKCLDLNEAKKRYLNRRMFLENEKQRKMQEKSWVNVKYGRHLIGTSGENHVVVIGGAGSGKTTSTIIPTLVSWKESVIVYDPKGELYEKTAGYRKEFSRVIYFNPNDLCSTFRFNPLDWVPRDLHAVADIQRLSSTAIPDVVGDNQPYFRQTARRIFSAVCSYNILFKEGKDVSIAQLFATIAEGNEQKGSTILTVIRNLYNNANAAENRHKFEDEPNPLRELYRFTIQNLQTLLNEAEEAFSSVVSTMLTDLQIFTDPVIATLTSDTTITVDEIQNGDSPISIYLTVPAGDTRRCGKLMSLILGTILQALVAKPVTNHQYRLLNVLDEFYQLGKIMEVYTSIPFSRGYGIFYLIVIQSIGQLSELYGKDGFTNFMENFSIKDIKKVADPDTAKWVESFLGNQTIVHKSVSDSGKKAKSTTESFNIGSQEIGKSLMTPDEIMKMPYSDEIILVTNFSPYLAKKIQSYAHPDFEKYTDLELPQPGSKAELVNIINRETPFTPATSHKPPSEAIVKSETIIHSKNGAKRKKKNTVSAKEENSLFESSAETGSDTGSTIPPIVPLAEVFDARTSNNAPAVTLDDKRAEAEAEEQLRTNENTEEYYESVITDNDDFVSSHLQTDIQTVEIGNTAITETETSNGEYYDDEFTAQQTMLQNRQLKDDEEFI